MRFWIIGVVAVVAAAVLAQAPLIPRSVQHLLHIKFCSRNIGPGDELVFPQQVDQSCADLPEEGR